MGIDKKDLQRIIDNHIPPEDAASTVRLTRGDESIAVRRGDDGTVEEVTYQTAQDGCDVFIQSDQVIVSEGNDLRFYKGDAHMERFVTDASGEVKSAEIDADRKTQDQKIIDGARVCFQQFLTHPDALDVRVALADEEILEP